MLEVLVKRKSGCFKLTNVNTEQKKCSVTSKEVREGESLGRPPRIIQGGKKRVAVSREGEGVLMLTPDPEAQDHNQLFRAWAKGVLV